MPPDCTERRLGLIEPKPVTRVANQPLGSARPQRHLHLLLLQVVYIMEVWVGSIVRRRGRNTMKTHTVTGGGGVQLHVVEAGNQNGRPILFIHGASQCWLQWNLQLNSSLADEYRLVALDMRGHGLSDMPRDGYSESKLWADDVDAVVRRLNLDGAVLSGWSYGPLVFLDYIRHYGEDRLGGLQFVGAVTKLGSEEAMSVLTRCPRQRLHGGSLRTIPSGNFRNWRRSERWGTARWYRPSGPPPKSDRKTIFSAILESVTDSTPSKSSDLPSNSQVCEDSPR